MTRLDDAAARETRRDPMARVRRNFWALAAVTTVAVGALSQALGRPAGPATAAMVGVTGLAALGQRHPRGTHPGRHRPTESGRDPTEARPPEHLTRRHPLHQLEEGRP